MPKFKIIETVVYEIEAETAQDAFDLWAHEPPGSFKFPNHIEDISVFDQNDDEQDVNKEP